MDIVFYKNSSEPERMTKTLSAGLTLTGALRRESDIVNPVILIEGDPADFPSDYNYAYISEFSRYYFVGDPVALRANLVQVPLSVDPLMSFKNAILNNYAIVDKQENSGSMYLNDGSWMHESKEFYTIKTFENGFNDSGEYILITAGA